MRTHGMCSPRLEPGNQGKVCVLYDGIRDPRSALGNRERVKYSLPGNDQATKTTYCTMLAFKTRQRRVTGKRHLLMTRQQGILALQASSTYKRILMYMAADSRKIPHQTQKTPMPRGTSPMIPTRDKPPLMIMVTLPLAARTASATA